MAVTQNLYTGNGSTTDFPFSFSYINPSYVKVSINGTLTTAFTFFTASILRFNTAPPNGAAIRIYRETPSQDLLADYTPGSAIRDQDLELTLQQVLDVTQETQTFAENQSTAGLQTQITAAGNNASTALTTANTAKATADGLAASIATANSNASSAVSTANTASSNASTALNTANSLSGAVTTAQATANAALPRSGGTLTGVITYDADQPRLVSGTSVASTSGNAIDFTGIPNWVKRITVMFSGVSTGGTSVIQIQLGTSTGFQVTGYSGAVSNEAIGTFVVASYPGSGFPLSENNAASAMFTGVATLVKLTSTRWCCSGLMARTDLAGQHKTAGSKDVGGTLDRLRITANGTDQFDAGTVNILFEG